MKRSTHALALIAPAILLLTANAYGAGNGLKGEYFNNTGLAGDPVLIRTDNTVNFQWRDSGPGSGIAHNRFSVRWTGQVEAGPAGAYKFATSSNDGIRLWVNGVKVIDRWSSPRNQAAVRDESTPINLTAGQKVDIKLEFFEDTGAAIARLYWTPPGGPEVVVPTSALYSAPLTPDGNKEPVYLSSLTPFTKINGYGPYQRNRSNGGNRSNDGDPITIEGIKFARGLGAHAGSELRYALNNRYLTFNAMVGVDDEVAKRGSVIFEVWLDGVKVSDSGLMRGTDPMKIIKLDVIGKKELKLIVTNGGDGIDYDHADWADARLLPDPAAGTGRIPNPPTGLVTKPGDRQIKLAWRNVSGATSYQIYRGTKSQEEGDIPVGTSQDNDFTDVNLTNGTQYFYQVAALNMNGTSIKSNEAHGTPSAGAGGGGSSIPAPTGLNATPGDKQVTLEWAAVTGANSYNVYRGTSSGGQATTAIKTGLTTPKHIDTGLTNGTTYFYKVAAVVNNVVGARSDEDSAKPEAAVIVVPPGPTNLTATPGDKQVSLAWTAVNGASSYNVYRGTATNAQASGPIMTGLTTPSFVNTGLTNETTYFYKVAAVINNVVSQKSNEANAKPAAPPIPAGPATLTATPGDKQVVLAWAPVNGASSYNVYRSTTSNGQSNSPISSGLTAPTFTNTGLTNGTTYFYKVSAVIGTVVSLRSPEASGKPEAPPLPGAPTGLTATPGDKAVVLAWTAVTGATSYNVYRGTTSNGQSNTAIATGLTAPAFTNTGLVNGTKYFYKVAALSAGGTGARSAEASATPTAPGMILSQAQKDAHRFLRQSTFGPTPALVDHVVQVGKAAFLDEQFALPATPYPDTLISMPNMELVSEQFFQNAMSGQDQLRQRVAWALSQIFVTSAIKVDNTAAMVPYIRMLQNNAFGNVKDLMRDVSLSPAMGEFLDMVNNKKATTAGALPNENYAREWLQLLSIGLQELNDDGTPMLTNGQPSASYTQATVADLARALTGWTYGDAVAGNPTRTNSPYYGGPMEPVERFHDVGAKSILGANFVAGQTTQQDFDQALTVIFNHHNVGPFLSRQLILKLVTSNPSPTYIRDITGVFNNNGQGVRGDLKAVVRAILLHPEAATGVKFSEPALFLTTFCRAICTNITDHPFLTDFSESMSQRIWFAPSIFNYYSPGYRVGSIVAPEMQIWTTATAMTRTNFVASLIRGGFGSNVTLNLAPFTTVANDANALLDNVNALIMGGTMSAQHRAAILTALNATTGTNERVRTALYLTAAAMQYQVEH